MGCSTCTKGEDGLPAGCRNNGACRSGGCDKLEVFDWLSGLALPDGKKPFDVLEVRFKNGRKHFYRNTLDFVPLAGDVLCVEANPGYDVGIVSLSGELVRLQLERKQPQTLIRDLRKVVRMANQNDLDRWKEARGMEAETMVRGRSIAQELGLDMKISDVEYQGDKSKVTFFYTCEGRVDFRELIKRYADEFKVRIEMRQIGARQEAARLGGIGSCGRELCCSTWLTDFRSVSTSAARYQQLSLNPQKLAGQCGKLKCCLNYELDSYVDALKGFPKANIKLRTKAGQAVHVKSDIFRKLVWYILDGVPGSSPVALTVEKVRDIIALNEQGKEPHDLNDYAIVEEKEELGFDNVVGQDSLTRFDRKAKGKKKRGGRTKPQGAASASQAGGRPKPKKPAEASPAQQPASAANGPGAEQKKKRRKKKRKPGPQSDGQAKQA